MIRWYHHLRSSILESRAKAIRSAASRDYRLACNRAARLERIALKHSRLAGKKLLAAQPKPEAREKNIRRSSVSLEQIREILGRVVIVRQ